MDIGEPKPSIIVEPVEDPFELPKPEQEPSKPSPIKTPAPVKVPA